MHTRGIHHITGITGDAQKCIDFYTQVLGLRFVKLTVNFDDPRAYHLYFGNESGEPGTALTFFAWPQVRPGLVGTGEITSIAFAVPASSLDFWKQHFAEKATPYTEVVRFGSPLLSLRDPDGLELELVPDETPLAPWGKGGVPEESAIRGFHAITMSEDGFARTRDFLTKSFGYAQDGEDGALTRFKTEGDAAGRYLYTRVVPDLQGGQMGAGTMHHVAFRAASDADEAAMREEMLTVGMDATPVIERMYFRSVYFREPGGALFEIATDSPGFTVDEPLESLGTSLKLPPQYEPHREEILRALPPLTLPHA